MLHKHSPSRTNVPSVTLHVRCLHKMKLQVGSSLRGDIRGVTVLGYPVQGYRLRCRGLRPP
eukprot:1840067-Pyramimonas_sp.AAC.1